jgi:hypothetical protein
MVLKKRILLGSSSSWYSRSAISVRSTESSTVATMCCCECMLNCSAQSESGNMSLRSWKGCQWLSICWVTLWCEGMTVTSGLEVDLSSRTKESSMRRLSCGNERLAVSSCWDTPSWDLCWENIWHTYHISSSPYYSEDIHTKITPWNHSKESWPKDNLDYNYDYLNLGSKY